MRKLEALKYIVDNFHGAQGGYQYAWLQDIIRENKDNYNKKELDDIIKKMTDY